MDSMTKQLSVPDTVNITAVPGELGADGATDVLVTLRPPNGSERAPADIVCVIDVSGSMGGQATVQNDQGVNEAMGLSILDVVKHAVKTIYHVLEPEDRLAIVKYSDNGEIAMELTLMDDAGKNLAERCIDALAPFGGTNIWNGLLKGLEVAQAASGGSRWSRWMGSSRAAKQGRFAHLLLLTDGCPTYHPPKGKGSEPEMLKDYKEKYQALPCTVSTFGFGYSLESAMLKDVAMEGKGTYGFIPDSGLVGTVFVNAISNLLTTMAQNVVLSIEPGIDTEIVEGSILGGIPAVTTSQGLSLDVGTLRYGQSRDVVVRMRMPTPISDVPWESDIAKFHGGGYPGSDARMLNAAKVRKVEQAPFLRATVTYEARCLMGNMEKLSAQVEQCTTSPAEPEVAVQSARLNAASALSHGLLQASRPASDSLTEAQQIIQAASDTIRNSSVAHDARVVALLEDLDGQVAEAFSRVDWFQKWGRHYIPSLAGAHLAQTCNNFKDPGVQVYGGTLFESLRDKADEIFVKIPPPKPSRRWSSTTSNHVPNAAPVNMSLFYNVGGGCFDGDCLIQMANGSQTALKDISWGDCVMTSSGPAQVACVVRTACPEGKAELVELPGGLLATPWHPVRANGAWRFPCQLAEPSVRSCDAVYNLVLRGGKSMFVSGVECVVLGHGIEDEVAAHSYFGTRKVVEDLERMPGWQEGLVDLMPASWVRDAATHEVCGLRAPHAAAHLAQ